MSPDEAEFYYTVGAFYFKEDQKAFLGSVGDRGGFFQGAEFNQPDVNAESWSVYGDFTWELSTDTRLTAGLRYTSDEKSRTGVNARYAFALGGFDINTGDGFSCCMGARVGTEGFDFAAFDRTIYDPDVDGSGIVSDQEFYDFYLNGINQFGRRDTLDDILALGPQAGGSETPAPCNDSDQNDSLICPQDGNHSYAVPISPNNSITLQQGEMEDSFIDWRLRLAHDFDKDMMGYAMVVTGHKSGGFNDTFKDPELGIDIAPTYDTEKVVMYETGLKNVFMLDDIRTTFNSSLFYYDYTDQVFSSILSVEQALDFTAGNVVDPGDIAPGALVVSFSYNAADSEIYGAQFDGKFEFKNDITLDWSALWLEAQIEEAEDIQDFRFQADVAPDDAVFRPISGKRLPHTPRYQFNLGLSQSMDLAHGSLDYKVSVGYRTEQFLTIFNGEDFAQPDNPRQRLLDEVPGYFTVDAGMGYWNETGNLRLEAFVNNLTGKVRPAAVIITQFDNTRFFTRPRTMGVRLKYYF
jgi:iron complex outermembrane receptor protein